MKKVQTKTKKKLDPDHPDFDSEEEYGSENHMSNDSDSELVSDEDHIDLSDKELDQEGK